jgi:RimJ/RimL family protein N-acetyltransferase
MARGVPGPIERVLLREVIEGDLPIFSEQQLDPAANRTHAFTAHWAKIMADDDVRIRTILADGRVAGHVASWVDATWLGKAEVTYWIGREYWGRGVATRALSEFLGPQRGAAAHLWSGGEGQYRLHPGVGEV